MKQERDYMEEKRFEDMAPEEKEASIKSINMKMGEFFLEAFKGLPMWVKLGNLANAVARACKEGKESEIDWDLINTRATENLKDTDFNAFERFTCPDDLYRANENCRLASILNFNWRKETCKSCGKTFYLTYNELEYFLKKGLSAPKRCRVCRADRKGVTPSVKTDTPAKPQPIKPHYVKPTEELTAMEIAMRKAEDTKGGK